MNPSLTSEGYAAIARAVLDIAGPGPIAVLGEAPALTRILRASGNAVRVGFPKEAEDGPREFLVVLSGAAEFPDDQVDALLSAAGEKCRGALLAFDLDSVLPTARGALARERWETKAFLAGMRRHPCYFQVTNYASLERERGLILIALESLPDGAREKHALSALAEERPLHMDMARETGRRSDGHMVKYAMAAALVRPGDVVVDAACGLGYGVHMLRNASPARHVTGLDLSDGAIAYARDCYGAPGVEFEVADVQELSGLADDSCDVFVSFETLEHVPDPDRVIEQAFRVLRPGGRFVASVPYDWSDEKGQDPNPFHLHVYDLGKLRRQVESRFVLERVWVQDAGGGFKLPGAERAIRPIQAEDEVQGEWLVIVGMKDPVANAGVPFVDTIYPEMGEARNIVAFARDYDNPWLMRSMFGMSIRMSSPAALTEMCRKVLASARKGSADEGAAICVLGYQAHGGDDPAAKREALALAEAFSVNADGSAHALRWSVSLSFLRGAILLEMGDRESAAQAFRDCVGSDWLRFSPTLATKVIEAAWTLGQMRLSEGDIAGAREMWLKGLSALTAALSAPSGELIGSLESPLPDPLPEMAHAIDLGRKCGQALAATHGDARSAIRAGREATSNQAADRDRVHQSHWAERRDLKRQVERLDRLKAHPLVRMGLPVLRKLKTLLR